MKKLTDFYNYAVSQLKDIDVFERKSLEEKADFVLDYLESKKIEEPFSLEYFGSNGSVTYFRDKCIPIPEHY